MTRLKITESEFQQQVIDLGYYCGFRVAHFRPAMKADGTWVTPVSADGAGFPDLCIVNAERKRVIWFEVKSEDGELSPEQYEWLYELQMAGQEAYLIKPSDWDEIVKLLSEARTEIIVKEV